LELKFYNDIYTFDVNVAFDVPLYELNPSPAKNFPNLLLHILLLQIWHG